MQPAAVHRRPQLYAVHRAQRHDLVARAQRERLGRCKAASSSSEQQRCQRPHSTTAGCQSGESSVPVAASTDRLLGKRNWGALHPYLGPAARARRAIQHALVGRAAFMSKDAGLTKQAAGLDESAQAALADAPDVHVGRAGTGHQVPITSNCLQRSPGRPITPRMALAG